MFRVAGPVAGPVNVPAVSAVAGVASGFRSVCWCRLGRVPWGSFRLSVGAVRVVGCVGVGWRVGQFVERRVVVRHHKSALPVRGGGVRSRSSAVNMASTTESPA